MKSRLSQRQIAQVQGENNTIQKPFSTYTDSVIEWFRDLPKTWDVKRLKYIAEINPSKSGLNLPMDTVVTFIPMERVGFGDLSLDEVRKLEDVYQGFTYFKDGDVVIAKITPSFENGKGAIATNLKNGIGFGTTELHVLRPSQVRLVVRNFFIIYQCPMSSGKWVPFLCVEPQDKNESKISSS